MGLCTDTCRKTTFLLERGLAPAVLPESFPRLTPMNPEDRHKNQGWPPFSKEFGGFLELGGSSGLRGWQLAGAQ